MGTWTKEDFADFKPDLPDNADDGKEAPDSESAFQDMIKPDMGKEDQNEER